MSPDHVDQLVLDRQANSSRYSSCIVAIKTRFTPRTTPRMMLKQKTRRSPWVYVSTSARLFAAGVLKASARFCTAGDNADRPWQSSGAVNQKNTGGLHLYGAANAIDTAGLTASQFKMIEQVLQVVAVLVVLMKPAANRFERCQTVGQEAVFLRPLR